MSEGYSELSWIVCGSFLNRALHGLKVLFGGKAAPETRTTNCLQANACAKQEDMTKHYLGEDETESRVPEIRSRFEAQMLSTPPSGLCEIPPPLAAAACVLVKVFCLPSSPPTP